MASLKRQLLLLSTTLVWYILLFLQSVPLSQSSYNILPSTSKGGRDGYFLSNRHLLANEANHSQGLEVGAKGYMTNIELEKAMKEFTGRCQNISRMYSIGKSVMGNPLWAIEIADKPGEDEAEPSFKFVANMHGDEPVGRELLLLLANWLCDNYLKEPLATLIIENVHLHLLPTMNPDGFSLRRRGNANNVDLNRDFPDQFFSRNDDEDSRQPETKAIMDWARQKGFTASASLHGGALVANYPWDGTDDLRKKYFACPDDTTFKFLASLYSRFHYNMSHNQEFQGGITNGAAWYPIYGGMQDWNYLHGECFELTLELSEVKWPPIEEVPMLWRSNKMSMLNLVAGLVKTGIHGRIFSARTGRPLPALVDLKGINHSVRAGQHFGDYHRLLAPDQRYEVTASMPGYMPKSATVFLESEAVNVDFVLVPVSGYLGQDQLVRDCSCKGRCELMEVFMKSHVEIYVCLVLLILFLLFLWKRRTSFKVLHSKQPRTSRRVTIT